MQIAAGIPENGYSISTLHTYTHMTTNLRDRERERDWSRIKQRYDNNRVMWFMAGVCT